MIEQVYLIPYFAQLRTFYPSVGVKVGYHAGIPCPAEVARGSHSPRQNYRPNARRLHTIEQKTGGARDGCPSPQPRPGVYPAHGRRAALTPSCDGALLIRNGGFVLLFLCLPLPQQIWRISRWSVSATSVSRPTSIQERPLSQSACFSIQERSEKCTR
jgi:hypothetical protein